MRGKRRRHLPAKNRQQLITIGEKESKIKNETHHYQIIFDSRNISISIEIQLNARKHRGGKYTFSRSTVMAKYWSSRLIYSSCRCLSLFMKDSNSIDKLLHHAIHIQIARSETHLRFCSFLKQSGRLMFHSKTVSRQCFRDLNRI